MRKFYKSLAVLLAFVLIIGVVPASAAVDLVMDETEKILYLDGSQGASEDGTKVCKISYKKKVANMIKGFDADTMVIDLKSDDETVVKTTKYGRIKAVALGTANVVVTVYNEDEEQIFQKDLKVKVKKNATDVTVIGIEDGASYKVGESLEVSLPRQGVDTDQRALTSDSDVATVAATDKSRVYKVTFAKEGEATLTAKAYQSTKYNKATATKTIKVKVGKPVPSDVKVLSTKSYELIFDTNVADVFKSNKDIADDAVYYLSNDVKIPFTGVKEVKTTDNIVKVTMFNNFASGVTYYVSVNGSEPLSFVINGTAAKDVNRIQINTTTLVKDKDTDISVSLFNNEEIEITDAVGTADIVLTSSDNLKLWPQGGLKATMYNVGDTADLKATFTYYDANNNYNATVKEDTKTITCVAAPVAQKTGKVYTLGGSQSSPKNYIALGETLKFQCWLKETLNGTTNDKLVGKDTFANLGSTYAKIADTSIAMITADDNAGGYTVKGNQVGNTYVFICYTDAAGKEQILDSCPIEVRAARFAQKVELSISKSNINLNASDSVKITAKVTDNYNEPYGGTLPTWTQVKASESKGVLSNDSTTGAKFAPTSTTGKYEMTVLPGQITYTADGAVMLTVKAGDKSNQPTVTFNVAKKGITPNGYSFTIDKASLDTSINAIKTAVSTATINLTAVKDGYFVDNQGYDEVLNAAKAAPNNSNAASYGAFTLDIKKDGKQLNLNSAIANGSSVLYSNFINVNTTTGEIKINSYCAPSTAGAITKLPAGNYAFELYIIKSGKVDGSVRRCTLAVTDSQVKPTFKKVGQSVKDKGSVEACFEFTFDGKKQTAVDTTPANYVTRNYKSDNTTVTSIFVSKADVALAITDGNGAQTGIYTIAVDVNTLLDP